MSVNPPKRPRLTGSFSPASPPYHLAKGLDQTKAVVHPDTPTSPPYMSATSQANGAINIAATGPFADMTPPSSVHMSQHPSQQQPGQAANSLPFPTPASTTGATNGSTNDCDGDAMMEIDGIHDGARSAASVSKPGVTEHRRSNSNHDRVGRGHQAGKVAVFGEVGAHGDALFKLCQSPHVMSRPHASQNLISLYGLDSLASTVARNDPVTGEKINKIRKSYEGIIKTFQIAGRPKAKQVENAFMEFMVIPDEDYEVMTVGKELESGLAPDILRSLDQALSMAPGPIEAADTQHYRSYLATDDSTKAKAGPEVPGKRPLQPNPTARNSAAPSPAMRASRPERQGAKRRYNDTSFSGYGEGFGDEEVADSTAGEEDGRSGFPKKKRRKDVAAGSPFGLERSGHQVGLVGARR